MHSKYMWYDHWIKRGILIFKAKYSLTIQIHELNLGPYVKFWFYEQMFLHRVYQIVKLNCNHYYVVHKTYMYNNWLMNCWLLYRYWLMNIAHMRHDQEEWVGCWRCCFWYIGKNSVQIPLFYIVLSLSNPSLYRVCIKMKHFKIMRKWCKKTEIEIFDKWLISLDHVTLYGCVLNLSILCQNKGVRVQHTAGVPCVPLLLPHMQHITTA